MQIKVKLFGILIYKIPIIYVDRYFGMEYNRTRRLRFCGNSNREYASPTESAFWKSSKPGNTSPFNIPEIKY
ncbi:hypothetical protein CCDG5_0677 [[Clostridium] cellulosi]|jgi:hypothetical protein|uniref:Uncharacterized protein n=1 Tax=[Clostridium] cellulosi TaxID=29343 RepID=A0A078KJK3_9FIRM|nr:hypothetical protein CCDG5_0677 [[Clostridium] cellulosi]